MYQPAHVLCLPLLLYIFPLNWIHLISITPCGSMLQILIFLDMEIPPDFLVAFLFMTLSAYENVFFLCISHQIKSGKNNLTLLPPSPPSPPLPLILSIFPIHLKQYISHYQCTVTVSTICKRYCHFILVPTNHIKHFCHSLEWRELILTGIYGMIKWTIFSGCH